MSFATHEAYFASVPAPVRSLLERIQAEVEARLPGALRCIGYNMPAFKQLGDAELAAVASHVRGTWSNKAPPLTAELIAQERKASTRTTPFAGGAELKALTAKP